MADKTINLLADDLLDEWKFCTFKKLEWTNDKNDRENVDAPPRGRQRSGRGFFKKIIETLWNNNDCQEKLKAYKKGEKVAGVDMFAYAQNELKSPWEKSGEYWLNLGQSNKVIVTALRALLKHCGINEATLTYTPPEKDPRKLGFNRIIFGAPGTGKSHQLNSQAEDCFGQGHTERVTFHPEYTYFDFVGSYKPVMRAVPATYVKEGKLEKVKNKQGKPVTERKIEYDFVPGPFTRILVKALKDEKQSYLLLIEEINRARVAAVFGDIFQLLDRDSKGESEYSICLSEDLKEYLKEQGSPLNELKLPPNLYIWATMNSADQGVYSMDTAFKRRWSFEYIGINDCVDDVEGKDEKVVSAWKEIRTRINDLLQKAKVNEDKQLGPFFLYGKELENKDSFLAAFKSKVLMYLYEDAARYKRDEIFETKGIRYSGLCDSVENDLENLLSLFKEVGDGREDAR